MSFGYDRQGRAFVGDSIKLIAILEKDIDDTGDMIPVPFDLISSATFTIQRPQDAPGTFVTLSGDVGGPDDEDGKATVIVPSSVNDAEGQYQTTCRFVWGTNLSHDEESTTVPCPYEISDAFKNTGSTRFDPAVDATWEYINDLFDSEYGGPWLRDVTRGDFDKDKIRIFAGQVLFDINATPPMVTAYTIDSFLWGQDATDTQEVIGMGMALFAQGLLVHTIRHLIRSYVEQPDQTNSPVAFFNRARYVDAWSAVYNMELTRYTQMLELFKRGQLNTGGRLLVSTRAGRGIFPGMRSRGVWRGYS